MLFAVNMRLTPRTVEVGLDSTAFVPLGHSVRAVPATVPHARPLSQHAEPASLHGQNFLRVGATARGSSTGSVRLLDRAALRALLKNAAHRGSSAGSPSADFLKSHRGLFPVSQLR